MFTSIDDFDLMVFNHITHNCFISFHYLTNIPTGVPELDEMRKTLWSDLGPLGKDNMCSLQHFYLHCL